MELQFKQGRPVPVTGLAFPQGEVNNFVVASEDGNLYTGQSGRPCGRNPLHGSVVTPCARGHTGRSSEPELGRRYLGRGDAGLRSTCSKLTIFSNSMPKFSLRAATPGS